MHIHCPHCRSPVEVVEDQELRDVICPSCGSSFNLLPDETVTRIEKEQKTLGHFQLLDRIGVGAFGEVWTAHDQELDRTVAIKLPRKGQLSAEEAESFFREARSAARLHHPGIVTVHEVGKAGDQLFIVSDYVRGATLSDWLIIKRPTPRQAAELVTQLADAVQHAHEHGVVHRDLKPSNVMLDDRGQAHIMDFGLAKREAGEITVTLDGKILGTPAYMSPEQAKGAAHQADARSDVYSLGVIFYELLTGELPFRGSTRMLVHQVINDDPPSLRSLNSSLPRDLETIALKCLEKDPGKRYQTARALAADLRAFAEGRPIQARPVGRIARAWRWCSRNPVVAGLATALVGSLLCGLVGVTWQWFQTKREAERYRELVYISDMNAAHQAWEEANISRLRELLREHNPQKGMKDLRKFEWYYLWRSMQCSESFMNIPVEGQPECLSLFGNPQSGCLVAADARGGISLWELEGAAITTRRVLRTPADWRWFESFVLRLPDGNTLIYPTRDGKQLLLQRIDGTGTPDVLDQAEEVASAAMSPSGRLIAAASTSGLVRIWDLSSRQLQGTLREGAPGRIGKGIHVVAFSPDQNRLAVGTDIGVVEVWNVSQQTLEYTLTATAFFAPGDRPVQQGAEAPAPDRRNIFSVDFSPDSSLLAAGLDDCTIRVWNLASRDEQILSGHNGTVFAVAFSPTDGSLLASGSRDNTVRLWRLAKPKESHILMGHSDGVVDVVFSRDGRTLVSAGLDYSIRIWSLEQLAAKEKWPGAERGGVVALGHDDKSAISIRDGVVHCWDLTTGSEDPRFSHIGGSVLGIAVSRNGILATRKKGGVDLWHATTGQKQPRTLALPLDWAAPINNKCMAFSPNGRKLAVGGHKEQSDTSRVFVWETDTEKVPTEIAVPAVIKCLALGPDGRYLAAAAGDLSVRVWDTETGEEVCQLAGHRDEPVCVTFSPDGTLIASSGFENDVLIWDWRSSGQPAKKLRGHTVSVFSLGFSDDMSTLFVAEADGVIRIWDVRTWQPRCKIAAGYTITYVAISRDGKMLLGASESVLQLWRAASEEEVRASGWYAQEAL